MEILSTIHLTVLPTIHPTIHPMVLSTIHVAALKTILSMVCSANHVERRRTLFFPGSDSDGDPVDDLPADDPSWPPTRETT